MAQEISVKANDKQLVRIMKVLEMWENNPKRYGIIELVGVSSSNDGNDDDKEKNVITLKVSGEITYDVWAKFCKMIKMRIVFPGY